MTGNELEKVVETIPHQTASYRFFNKEFGYVLEMINSCICYSKYMKERDNIDPASMAELIYNSEPYLQEFGRKYGRSTIVDLIDEQVNDIDHIEYNSAEDGEGCVYNHIVWRVK